MAAKPEEINTAPVEGAGPLAGAGLEKQPEPVLTVESTEKKDAPIADDAKVDEAAAGVADLSVVDKKTEESLASAAVIPPPQTISETPAPAAADAVTATQGPVWPETAPEHPLTKFYDAFEAIVTEASHNEVYGIELSKSNAFHTKLILQKFLRANQNDLDKAKQQLLETLKWRKEFDPVKATGESFEKARFDGLGYVLEVAGVPDSPNAKDIVTFNIYGAVKDNKATFGDLEA